MRTLSWLLLATRVPGSLLAQTVITGTVREDSTGRLLALVEVSIEGAKQQGISDATGRYTLQTPLGNHVILFRLTSYQSQRIRYLASKGDTVRLDVLLVKQGAQELPEVETRERPGPVPGSVMAGFEERRHLGFGKFIDSTEMRLTGRRIVEVLRPLGLRFVNFSENRGPQELRAASATTVMDQGDFCWVSVFLDGVAIYRAGNKSTRPPDFLKEFSVTNLMAAEYYRSSASVPSEFGVGRDTDCGVLVLWTRRGL